MIYVRGKKQGVNSAIVLYDENAGEGGREHKSDTRCVTPKKHMAENSLMKFIYFILLRELDKALIVAFLESHPLKSGDHNLSLSRMIECFWKPRGRIPLFYYCSVFHDIESFFAKNGLNFKEALCRALEEKLFLDASTWVLLISNIPESILVKKQIDRVLLESFCHIFHTCCPSVKCTMLGCISENNKYRYTFMLDPGPLHFPPFEFSSTFGILLKYLPVRFNESTYSEVHCHAERMTFESIAEEWTDNDITDEFQLCDPELYGHYEDFYTYASECGYNLPKMNNESVSVFVMDRDYRCSDQKRTILKKGMALGAPFYLFTVVCNDDSIKTNNGPGSILKRLNNELRFPSRTKFSHLEKQHKELVKKLDVPVTFKYNQSSESIYCENCFITSSVQARLLLSIIQKYLFDGRTEFTRKEFVKDSELISSPQNTGFAVRLRRVQELLNRFNTPIKIVKLERGRFRIETQKAFELLIE